MQDILDGPMNPRLALENGSAKVPIEERDSPPITSRALVSLRARALSDLQDARAGNLADTGGTLAHWRSCLLQIEWQDNFQIRWVLCVSFRVECHGICSCAILSLRRHMWG